MPQLKTQADERFRFWLSLASCPTLINSYLREYYESMDRQVRITVDYRQQAWEQLTYPRPNLAAQSQIERLVVVEIKADVALHRRVANVLCAFPLPAERHSKYVTGISSAPIFM